MSSPLKIVILGLDERAKNLFRMFFRGPCQNQAVIVDQEKEAEAFLIDLDTPQGSKLLAQQRENHPARVFIALSVRDQEAIEGTVFVKKPTQAQGMITAINQARALAKAAPPTEKFSLFNWGRPKPKAPPQTPPPPPPNTPKKPAEAAPPPAARAETPSPGMKVVATADKGETTVHRVAMLLDEQGFKSYLGHRDDIDPSKPDQVAGLFYDPKAFLQGHVQSAIKVAVARNEAMRLETPWKSITILPRQGLIHILADEAQVRAACGIPFRNIVGLDIDATSLQQAVNVKPVNEAELEEILNSKEVARLDSFLWKIALFTSKGRLPKNIDINQAVFLKRWPGMTRLMLPPHAMRIAALLVQEPHSLFDVARKMGVRQQYVFAFVSAAHALGLVGQQPMPAVAGLPPEAAKPDLAAPQPERTSLLKKILSRLKLI